MQITKVQVKVQQDEDKFCWVHFCYVPREIKERFDQHVNPRNLLSNHWLAQWAYKEFELLDVDTPNGMEELKKAIKDKYKQRYPELYVDSATDKQGWLRVWYTENMEQELKDIGK